MNRVVLKLRTNTLCISCLRLLTCPNTGQMVEQLFGTLLPLTSGRVTMLQWLNNVLINVSVCLADLLLFTLGIVDYRLFNATLVEV